MHLLKWEVLIKPKQMGGLNIRSAREMNWALLAKLVGRMICRGGQLWSEVLRAKYNVMEEDGPHLHDRLVGSKTWRGLTWGVELLRKGIRWEVHNRERVHFWKDVWIGKRSLGEGAMSGVAAEHVDRRVAEYLEQGRGWRWGEIDGLSPSQLLMLAMTVLRQEGDRVDCMGWMKPSNGRFSVKTAYQLAHDWTEEEVWVG